MQTAFFCFQPVLWLPAGFWQVIYHLRSFSSIKQDLFPAQRSYDESVSTKWKLGHLADIQASDCFYNRSYYLYSSVLRLISVLLPIAGLSAIQRRENYQAEFSSYERAQMQAVLPTAKLPAAHTLKPFKLRHWYAVADALHEYGLRPFLPRPYENTRRFRLH